uniref:Uncharacterized protein n=1 Tax=Ditylenchus dipsaci TaxID=166011 RepID=A0A915D6H6_9BILA
MDGLLAAAHPSAASTRWTGSLHSLASASLSDLFIQKSSSIIRSSNSCAECACSQTNHPIGEKLGVCVTVVLLTSWLDQHCH